MTSTVVGDDRDEDDTDDDGDDVDDDDILDSTVKSGHLPLQRVGVTWFSKTDRAPLILVQPTGSYVFRYSHCQ